MEEDENLVFVSSVLVSKKQDDDEFTLLYP